MWKQDAQGTKGKRHPVLPKFPFSERYRGRHLSGGKLTDAKTSGVFSIDVVAVDFLADEPALVWRSGLGQDA